MIQVSRWFYVGIVCLVIPFVGSVVAQENANKANQEEQETMAIQVVTDEEGQTQGEEQIDQEISQEPAEGEVVTETITEGASEKTLQEPETKPDEEVAAIEEQVEVVTEEQPEQVVVEEKPEEVSVSEVEEDEKKEEESVEKEPVVEQPELGPDEIMGIDTVDLDDPQGNWLYKRVWWERAEAKYEKIRATVNKILEMRTAFFAKRAELDKTVLDPFYIKIGLSQGELQEILSELIVRLSKSVQEKKNEAFLEKVEGDKKALEQIQDDVQKVVKQDEEVENAIMMLVEQINKIRGFEQQAWQDFKGIARVLDDKKARELFYKVDSAWRNIQELRQYVEQTYSESFDKLVERVKQQIQQIDLAVQALREKGIDLKQRIVQSDVQQQEQDDEEEEPPPGFIERYITGPIQQIMSGLWSIIMWPINKIMGRTEQVDDEQEMEEPEVEQVTVEQEVTQEVVAPETPPEAEQPAMPPPPEAIPSVSISDFAQPDEEGALQEGTTEKVGETEDMALQEGEEAEAEDAGDTEGFEDTEEFDEPDEESPEPTAD